jgi:type I restriction enzyme, S subunit
MSESELNVDMPNEAGWPVKSIDSLCSLISRGTAPVYVEYSEVLAIGQRCVSSTEFVSDLARPHSHQAMRNVLRPEPGDVLLNSTGTGTIGRSVVFKDSGNFVVDGHVTVLRPRVELIDSRWLNSVIRIPSFQRHLERFCFSGSTNQLELSRTPLRVSRIPTPHIDEQRAMGLILDTLNTAISETEAIIAKLKAVKQGLLHDLLTRGIDANGELRPPQSEAPHLYKESPLGWIPREWDASNVYSEFAVDSGITLGPHRAPRNRAHPYLRVANVYRARLKLDDIAWLEASPVEAASKAIQAGDLLLVEGHASTEEIGRCALANEAVKGMLFQNHLFRLRPINILPEFGLLWLNSSFSRGYWRNEAATSSGLNTINRKKLNSLGVAVPPQVEQDAIHSTAIAIDSKINVEEEALSKLQRQKSGLMDDLLTGRVRVTPLLTELDGSPAGD